MRRIAKVASLVARGYHDHLVDVQRFHKRDGIRVMLMEWIDGYDLRRLLHPRLLERFRSRASTEEWDKISAVVVTSGPEQSRLHPGAAITIVRDCLDGLKILHRMGILHGDLKPANIMLRRGGRAKIIDFGSAVISRDSPRQRVFTPAYAAPEVLTAKRWTPQSDLASLGYVVIELLTGQRLFPAKESIDELLARKHSLPARLPRLLPEQVTRSERLMEFLQRLVATDPQNRFMSAEQADLDPNRGAYAFLQELARGGLDAEWRNDLGIWVDRLKG
jgi:serine/threonine-protein kinase